MQSIAEKPIESLSNGLKDVAAKNPLEGLDTSDLNKFRPTVPFEKDEGTLDYLTAIGSLMSGISGATDNAAASWMNYLQNILQGTIALLPLLASVFKIARTCFASCKHSTNLRTKVLSKIFKRSANFKSIF